MDLNFLVFPKPDFKLTNEEAFYSKLLFVPKVNRNLKTIDLKKPCFGSRRLSEWNPSLKARVKDREEHSSSKCFGPKWEFKNTDPRQTEGVAIRPLGLLVRKAPEEEVTSMTQPFKKRGSSSMMFGENADEFEGSGHTSQILIPTMKKSVRFPKSKKLLSSQKKQENSSSSTAVVNQTSADKDHPLIKRVPHGINLGPGSKQTKHIRLTLKPKNPSNYQTPAKVSLSKLMNNLENFESLKINDSAEGFKTKTYLDSKYNNRSADFCSLTASRSSPRPKRGSEALNDSFTAPQEYPEKRHAPLSNYPSKMLKSLTHKRSQDLLTKVATSDKARQDLVRCALLNTNASEGDLHHNFAAKLKSIQARKNPFLVCRSDNFLETEEFDSVHAKIGHYSRLNNPERIFSGMARLNSKSRPPVQSASVSHSGGKPSFKKQATKALNLMESNVHEHMSIPCIVLGPPKPSEKVMLYFHANGEDIALVQEFCALLADTFSVDFISQVLGDRT